MNSGIFFLRGLGGDKRDGETIIIDLEAFGILGLLGLYKV